MKGGSDANRSGAETTEPLQGKEMHHEGGGWTFRLESMRPLDRVANNFACGA